MWYVDIDAQKALQSVASWISRTYKMFSITTSKVSGCEIEQEHSDEVLGNIKRQMKVPREVIIGYSKFDKSISTLDSDIIDVITKIEKWITEDMGGAFATLVAKLLALKGDAHYKQWRK